MEGRHSEVGLHNDVGYIARRHLSSTEPTPIETCMSISGVLDIDKLNVDLSLMVRGATEVSLVHC
jgi:hypothetical protein